MNIFVLDMDPYIAERYHCDAHVKKMVIEYPQLLSTCHHKTGTSLTGLYKPTHVNHPANIWVRESLSNYRWLYTLFEALCYEYRVRVGKKILTEIKLLDKLKAEPNLIDKGLTEFPQCLPLELQVVGDPVTAYRKFYGVNKLHFVTYMSPGKVPEWLIRGLRQGVWK